MRVCAYLPIFWVTVFAFRVFAAPDASEKNADTELAMVEHLGIQYSNAINSSGWRSFASELECRLEHTVPYFGEVVFRKRAGEASAFYLNGLGARFSAGEANVIVQPPAWRGGEEITLARVKVKRGKRPLWLGNRETEQMLAHLNGGREVFISRKAWFTVSQSEPARLSISNIGFRAEYRKYLTCLMSLLPASFEQLRRSAVYFPSAGSPTLPKSATELLDKIIMLIAKDTSIQKFVVDGHTDSVGDRASNLELAKHRAGLVRDYLKHHGVPDEQITMRWHGERYPVVSNSTAQGRAKNRRVTVRLERLEDSGDQGGDQSLAAGN